MNRAPESHVYVREELLYFDGARINVVRGENYELELADRAVMNCVHRGESEFGLLCRNLAELEIGGESERIAERLRTVFSSRRSLLELGPPPYVERPDVIVCDFDDALTSIDGRRLVRELRRNRRVLFLGLEKKVASSSPDSFWLERMRKRRVHSSWFRFAQWARSIIRFHEHATLVLLGHRDATLFGDLVANLPSVVVLDHQWPAGTGLGDLRGQHWQPADVIANLRSLFYSLRFSPYDDLKQLNRNSSSSLAGMEAYAVRHADVVCYSQADQIAEVLGMGLAREQLLHACLPPEPRRCAPEAVPTLVLVADLESGAQSLAPFLTLLSRIPTHERPYQRVALATEDRWLEVKETESGGTISDSDLSPANARCVAVLAFPGLLRDLRAAIHWMTSEVPVQLVRSGHDHPLQQGVDEVLFLGRASVASVQERLRTLAREDSDLRRDVLAAQANLARAWSVSAVIQGLSRRMAAAPA